MKVIPLVIAVLVLAAATMGVVQAQNSGNGGPGGGPGAPKQEKEQGGK